jgi:glycosyltransferase involved in cell wall biosynthesis
MESLLTDRAAHVLESKQNSAQKKLRPASPSNAGHTIRFCHFTSTHTALKSRSFHRQCLPLAEAGFNIRYISPASVDGILPNVEFVQIPGSRSVIGSLFSQISLLRAILRQDADVYHFQDPQVLPLALALKLLFRKRVIYDAYEDFPSIAAQKLSSPESLRPLAKKLMAAAESYASRKLDAVLTADPLTLHRLARIGSSEKRVLYNFPNLHFFPQTGNVTKRFDLVYRGGLSQRAGTFLLLEALRLLAADNVRPTLLLIGYSDGAQADETLRQQIDALGLTAQVEIRGRIPHEGMAAALGSARIGICPLLDTPKFRLNIPVKIFEYWACGLPVIASDLPPSRPFMRGSDAGVLCPPGDALALASSIADLLGDFERVQRMGRCGRAIVEHRLNNQSEARKLISLCTKLITSSHSGSREQAHA